MGAWSSCLVHYNVNHGDQAVCSPWDHLEGVLQLGGLSGLGNPSQAAWSSVARATWRVPSSGLPPAVRTQDHLCSQIEIIDVTSVNDAAISIKLDSQDSRNALPSDALHEAGSYTLSGPDCACNRAQTQALSYFDCT